MTLCWFSKRVCEERGLAGHTTHASGPVEEESCDYRECKTFEDSSPCASQRSFREKIAELGRMMFGRFCLVT
jgi:hypothetical protein